MYLVWTKPIKTDRPWEPDFYGTFWQRNGKVLFYFKDKDRLCCLSQDANAEQSINFSSADTLLTLPRKWIVLEECNTAYLVFDTARAVDLNTNLLVNSLPNSVRSAYDLHVKPEKYFEEVEFVFDTYSISRKGNCGYVCRNNGVIAWEFRGRAYLYTDIVRWNNRILFGTAGNSGYFYVLDISSGKPLASIKTGGTRNFEIINNHCYILANEKNARLLRIDLSSGDIAQQCDLPGVATVNSKLLVIDNQLHAITFNYRKDRLQNAIWNCVALL